MKPKTMEISYQEAENLIRQCGHSVTRKKQGDKFINTVTWSFDEQDVIKTNHTNEEIKILGLTIKKFSSDAIILFSLALKTEKDSK